MTRFFKMTPGKKEPQECLDPHNADFVEVYYNWESFAVPLVLGLMDASVRFKDRLSYHEPTKEYQVISPKTWFALFEYNSQYCEEEEATLLSEASLAIRPK